MTRRALVYFALVFALGFALGSVRVLWVVPAVGERAAELAEAPCMLAGILLAARWCVRRFPAAHRSSHLHSGLLALGLMLLVELTVVLALRGLTFSEYVATRDPVAGAVYVASLVVFALMPWLVGSRSLVRCPAAPERSRAQGDQRTQR